MELLNTWAIVVVLSFLNTPDYESHYQKKLFNNEVMCQDFLHENRMELEHDLIHIFDTQPEHLITINLQCKIIKGEPL